MGTTEHAYHAALKRGTPDETESGQYTFSVSSFCLHHMLQYLLQTLHLLVFRALCPASPCYNPITGLVSLLDTSICTHTQMDKDKKKSMKGNEQINNKALQDADCDLSTLCSKYHATPKSLFMAEKESDIWDIFV